MRRISLFVLIIAALALHGAGQARAAADVTLEVVFSETWRRCMDRAGGVTAEMIACAGAEAARWDRRLNAAYRALMASPAHAPATKALLREAQRAWVAFRDRGCAAEGEFTAEGGSLSRILAADCALRMTAQRALDLEDLARGPEAPRPPAGPRR
jgi:uncharacterized protein YecT (DUF1311 family)